MGSRAERDRHANVAGMGLDDARDAQTNPHITIVS